VEKESPTEKKRNSNGKMEAGVKLNNSCEGIQNATNGLKSRGSYTFFVPWTSLRVW
jgi:hypothetical protein